MTSPAVNTDTTDILSSLPSEILMKIALDLPIDSVASVCSTSSKLAKLCNNELFWRQRLAKDFPLYSPPIIQALPDHITYKAYYQFLVDIWNFKDARGKYVINEIEGDGTKGKNSTMALIFPAPRFEVKEGNLVYGDVIIRRFRNKYLILISSSERKTLTGRPIPALGEGLEQTPLDMVPDNQPYRDHIEMGAKAGLAKSILIYERDLIRFLNEAREKGYVRLLTGEEGYITLPDEVVRTSHFFMLTPYQKMASPRKSMSPRSVRWSL